jgi:type I restriction enzyme S subunit
VRDDKAGDAAMTALLPRYPAYKASGVLWLGDVPAHWQTRRLKYLLRERVDRSTTGTEQLLRVSQYTGITERKRSDGGDEPDTRAVSLIGHKLVSPGDLVVNIMLAWNGSLGVSPFRGIVSPAYCIYRFGESAVPWYYHHLLRSPAYRARIKALSTGVVESRLRLYTDDLYPLEALLPPLPEQQAIVRYLDHHDRLIRKYLRAKQREIALLQEQKQAIIHQAVTRGLNPDAPMKPLGSTPPCVIRQDWSTPRLWQMARVRSEKDAPDLSLLSVFLGRGVINYSEGGGQVHKPSRDLTGYQVVHPGDLVLNNQQAWRGSVGISPSHGIISPAYVVLALDTSLEPGYAKYLFPSQVMVAQYLVSSKGVGDIQRDVHVPWLMNARVPVPLRDEQLAIAETLDRKVRAIDHSIVENTLGINLLHEYRARLIADVVTGQVDVRAAVEQRAAAAALPDETEDPDDWQADEVEEADEGLAVVEESEGVAEEEEG